jgi:hypothetical protein
LAAGDAVGSTISAIERDARPEPLGDPGHERVEHGFNQSWQPDRR